MIICLVLNARGESIWPLVRQSFHNHCCYSFDLYSYLPMTARRLGTQQNANIAHVCSYYLWIVCKWLWCGNCDDEWTPFHKIQWEGSFVSSIKFELQNNKTADHILNRIIVVLWSLSDMTTWYVWSSLTIRQSKLIWLNETRARILYTYTH